MSPGPNDKYKKQKQALIQTERFFQIISLKMLVKTSFRISR